MSDIEQDIKDYRKKQDKKMKRNIRFKKVDGFNAMFDVCPNKRDALEKKVNELIAKNKTFVSIILHINENFDLSDNEWSNFMYGMGFVAGQAGAR